MATEVAFGNLTTHPAAPDADAYALTRTHIPAAVAQEQVSATCVPSFATRTPIHLTMPLGMVLLEMQLYPLTISISLHARAISTNGCSLTALLAINIISTLTIEPFVGTRQFFYINVHLILFVSHKRQVFLLIKFYATRINFFKHFQSSLTVSGSSTRD